jgi:hypothetical protein
MSFRLPAAFLTLLAGAGLALAQDAAPEEKDAQIKALKERIASLEKQLEAPKSAPETTTAPLHTPADLTTPPAIHTDCPTSCAGPRFYGSTEYLLWWIKNQPVPAPLITTTSAPITLTSPTPGAIGGPGTTVLLGGRDYDNGQRNGGRFTIGGWLDPEQRFGVEGSYLFLANQSFTHTLSTPGGPGAHPLIVPFNNPETISVDGFTLPAGQTVGPYFIPFVGAIPGVGALPSSASLTVFSRMDGYELNGVYGFGRSGGPRFEVLAGFRNLNLHEQLRFATTNSAPTNPFVAVSLNTLDQFDTKNDFFGGQVGGRMHYTFRGVELSATGKVAIGSMYEQVGISGQTSIAGNLPTGLTGGPGGNFSFLFPGGNFAQPTNIGEHSQNRFAVVPEVTLDAGYWVTSWARISVGYTFLYASEVARPGNQIDPSINIAQTGLGSDIVHLIGVPIPGPARPAYLGSHSDFWAQGVNFGLEFRF